MKRKILGVALSLALLSSLFVFSAPVSAANPNSMDFLVTLGSYVSGPTDNWQVRWLGAPIEVTLPYDGTPETRQLNGTVKAQSLIDRKGEVIRTYDCAGTFGEGTAILYFEMLYDNFQSMRMVWTSEWELIFDNAEWEGTILISRVVKSEIVEWRYGSGSSVLRDAVVAHWGVIEGTGDFENFHYVQKDPSMAGSMTIGGTGFFTPN